MRILNDIAAPPQRFFDFIGENLFLLLLIVGVVAVITVVLILLLKKKNISCGSKRYIPRIFVSYS